MSEEGSRVYRELLSRSTVPDYFMDASDKDMQPQPLSDRALAYEDLMALLQRIEDAPAWGEPDPVHPNVAKAYREILAEGHESAPDVFEGGRRAGETRRQAKTRIMLEAYARDGGQIQDADLWKLRAQYVYVRSYVQGRGQGMRYDTNNWVHFYNRYGMGGRDPEIMVGLWKSTVEEMGRMSMIEGQSRWALRLLGH